MHPAIASARNIKRTVPKSNYWISAPSWRESNL
jgi:hypothetical protein